MPLKYITFNQLMSSVESDLSSFADNDMIDRGKIIKVIRKINSDIGLKINKEKEIVVEIKDYKADLPSDFMFLELALACTVDYQYVAPPSFGTVTVESNKPTEVFHNNHNACLNECGGCYWVTQEFKEKIVKYEKLVPLSLTKRTKEYCSEGCMNLNIRDSAYDIDIDYENGEIIVPFRHGKIYLRYLCDMVNDDNEVLVLDHPLVRDYYEYAIKVRLLENWFLNTDADVVQKLMYAKEELRKERIRSMNFTNTPEYSEISGAYNLNRKRFYNKYHKMFDKF